MLICGIAASGVAVTSQLRPIPLPRVPGHCAGRSSRDWRSGWDVESQSQNNLNVVSKNCPQNNSCPNLDNYAMLITFSCQNIIFGQRQFKNIFCKNVPAQNTPS